jgi:hypothetical protein
LKIPPIHTWEDEITFSNNSSAWVLLEMPDCTLSVEVQLAARKHGFLDAHGVSWNIQLGTFRLRIALQRNEDQWCGVGSVRARRGRYQFEAVFERKEKNGMSMLAGIGVCRKGAIPVSCKILLNMNLQRLFTHK